MAYDEDNILNNNESIFSTLANQQSAEVIPENLQNIKIHENNFIKNFFDSVSSKLKEVKMKKEQEEAEQILNEIVPFLRMLYDYGCTIDLNIDGIIIKCDFLNKTGKLTINKDKSVDVDDSAKEILQHVANLINKTGSLSDIIGKYEEQGFYPVGELTKEKAIINGEECEVFVGILENNKKEKKTIYYYNGNELFLS